MAIPPERVLSNLREVRGRIAASAARSGRRAEAVRLVAVTKTAAEETIRTLVEAASAISARAAPSNCGTAPATSPAFR